MRLAFLLGASMLALTARTGAQTIHCVKDSPERVGQPGCSILESRPLPNSLPSAVYWHVDAFESMDDAKRAADSTAVVFSAHGYVWVTTVENDTTVHRDAHHRAWVGPIPLQPGRAYAMQVMSAYFLPGQRSRVHTHSGPEAWYVLVGEQCLETTTRVIRASAGQGAVVADGDTMRLVATGTGPRRALVLIVYDATQDPTRILDKAPALKSCV